MNRRQVAKLVFTILAIYMVVTVSIGRFINPWMTETELFLNTPKFLILNFK